MINCEGIAPLYPGRCECPNDCGSHGKCNGKQCVCDAGWGGADCSEVVCPDNACSGHGDCKKKTGCHCTAGFTGQDCSIPVTPLEPLPMTVDLPYWQKDPYGDAHPLLNRTEMATIRVTIGQADLRALLDPENAFNQSYVKVPVTIFNNNIRVDLDDAGFRLHGFSTRLSSKKSWALSFDKYSKGRLVYGLTGLKLNGERTDPTVVREATALDVYRAMSIPAARGSYAELYVNGVYSGLYLMLEDVDEAFLKGRVGNHAGQLYKCRSGAGLDFRGADPATYADMTAYYLNQTWHIYELDSDPQAGDYVDVAKLITAINATGESQFVEQVDALFDMDLFIRSMVLEVLLAQVDAYAYNGNNFRLYHDKSSGKLLWLPFDFDVSQGSCVEFPPGDPWTRDWAHQDLYSWGFFSTASICGGIRPLMTRMLQTPLYRAQFNGYVRALLSKTLNVNPDLPPKMCATAANAAYDGAPIYTRMAAMRALIESSRLRDKWLALDNNWANEDFEGAFCGPTTHYVPADKRPLPMVRWGLTEFLRERVRSARQQLDPQ